MIDIDVKLLEFEEFEVNQVACTILVELHIGQKHVDGADIFNFTLCNPAGLIELYKDQKEYDKNRIVSLKGYSPVVMNIIDQEYVRDWVRKIVSEISQNSDNWDHAVVELKKYFNWEYE